MMDVEFVEIEWPNGTLCFAKTGSEWIKLAKSKGINIPTPFPRMTWHEAMNRFGTDRPDTRFGMELKDISHIAAEMGF